LQEFLFCLTPIDWQKKRVKWQFEVYLLHVKLLHHQTIFANGYLSIGTVFIELGPQTAIMECILNFIFITIYWEQNA
jgi:hypothetical protein